MNKKHILIIEDDINLASLLSKQLISFGFEVKVAVDGERGLKAIEEKPDLILLDIMLPKIDGIAVMKAIRDISEWGIKVPIIIASNLSPDDNRVIDSITQYSPAFYLIKAEHTLNDIVEKIKDILKSR